MKKSRVFTKFTLGANFLLVAGLCLYLFSPGAAWAKRTVLGQITNQAGRPLVGVLVRAYDSDAGNDDFMGKAYTNSQGRYRINYRGGHWDPSPSHKITKWRPDIYIKVFVRVDGKWEKAYTSKVYGDQRLRHDRTINARINVTSITQRRTIRGRIIYANGRPAAGLLIKAKDKDPDKNDHMGQVLTNANGEYLIRYRGGHWDPSVGHGDTRWRPDIYITVFVKNRNNQWVRTYKSRVFNNHRLRLPLVINARVPVNHWIEKRTAFDPARHGFRFANDKRKVCAAPTCKDEHVGKVFRKVLRFNWALCGGMSLSALRRFNRGKPVPDFSPKLKEELVRYQMDTLLPSNWSKFVKWQARPTRPHRLALHTIGFGTKQEWPRLKRSLDRGKPRVIGLIRIQSNNPGRTGENHQVLAIGYRMNPLTRDIDIYVYDPNHPGKTSRIYFNTGYPKSQIHAGQTTPSGNPSRPLREKVRGFFVINVSAN